MQRFAVLEQNWFEFAMGKQSNFFAKDWERSRKRLTQIAKRLSEDQSQRGLSLERSSLA